MTNVDDTIISLLDRPIAFNPVFARIGGSAASGVMMSQSWYWTARTKDADGWFFKSMEEWTTETGLSRSEQETARKNLQARGLMDYEKRGMPARMYYRVNKQAVLNAIKALHQPVCRSPANSTAPGNLRRGRAANMFAETSQTCLPESGKQDCRDPANMIAEVPQASLPDSGNDKENTTEISTETYPEITTTALPKAAPRRGPPVVVSRVCRGPDSAMTPLTDPLPETIKKTVSDSELAQSAVAALLEVGVARGTAQRIVQQRGAKTVQDWVEAVKGGHVDCTKRGPAAILVAALGEGDETWNLPQSYLRTQRNARRRAAQQAEEARQAQLHAQAAEQVRIEREGLETRWNEIAAPMRAEIEEQARQEIEKRPMGKRLLEGPIGKETLRERCMEIVASYPASKCGASGARGGNQRAPTNNERETPLQSQNQRRLELSEGEMNG